jgi:hypothetical protein
LVLNIVFSTTHEKEGKGEEGRKGEGRGGEKRGGGD